MENRYDLTIVIPHYNTPELLRNMLSSIGKPRNTQIIVVDDHSDRELETLSSCRQAYSHVLFLETEDGKKGAGAARNTGMLHAKGNWLMFADADDVLVSGWFEIVSGYLESDEFDMVCFSPVGKRSDGSDSDRHVRYADIVQAYLNNEAGSEARLRYRFTVPWSKLIRTELVKSHGIQFDEIMYSNDVMFSARIGHAARRIAGDQRPVYCLIDREGSLTHETSGKVYCDRLRILCEREQYLNTCLTREEMNACGRMCLAYKMMEAMRRGYGLDVMMKMVRLFRQYGLPFIVLNHKKWIRRLYHRG